MMDLFLYRRISIYSSRKAYFMARIAKSTWILIVTIAQSTIDAVRNALGTKRRRGGTSGIYRGALLRSVGWERNIKALKPESPDTRPIFLAGLSGDASSNYSLVGIDDRNGADLVV
jgi:hypothetical protein